jgi:hypothetical protein
MRLASSLTRSFMWVQVVLLLATGTSGLVACGDKPQTAGTSSKKQDLEAYSGGANAAFAAPGWKPGDEASWEQQMKARNQNQNEYTRTR